ncbi:MAG: hypothetical protein Q3983_07600 [Capnocytophaga sp.]|nr:hypothetical protein [Capnocytophaga sp.]
MNEFYLIVTTSLFNFIIFILINERLKSLNEKYKHIEETNHRIFYNLEEISSKKHRFNEMYENAFEKSKKMNNKKNNYNNKNTL